MRCPSSVRRQLFTFSTSPLKPLNGIQRNLTGSKISMSFIKFVFFGPIGKTRWPPWPLIGLDIFEFSSETAEQNSAKLDRKQDLKVLYQICGVFFGPIGKTRWPPRPLIGWNIFYFSSETVKSISTKLDRKQKILMSSTKFVFFGSISSRKWPLWSFCKKMARCTQVHDMWPFGPLVIIEQGRTCYTPRNEVRGGILESPCPSVRPSVRL